MKIGFSNLELEGQGHHHGSDTPTFPRAVLHHTDANLCTILHRTVHIMKLCDLHQILNQKLVSKNNLAKVNEYQFHALNSKF